MSTGNSPVTIESVPRWIEIGFKAMMVIGIIANLYLSSNYISKADYARDKDISQRQFDNQAFHITEIEKAIALLSSQKTQLEDHEHRLRDLEKAKK